MSEGALEPIGPELNALPAPREFGAMLQARLDDEIMRMRTERGDVIDETTIYPLVRGLVATTETLGEYGRALAAVATSAEQEIAEELMAIPGNEQDGTPMHAVTVPDLDGTDIRLGINKTTKRTFTAEAITSAATAAAVPQDAVERLSALGVAAALGEDVQAEVFDVLVRVAEAAVERVLAVGNWTPQVTKLNAFAKEMAGGGDDQLASVIKSAIHEKRVYQGIKIERQVRK